jgi:hypothetical protein
MSLRRSLALVSFVLFTSSLGCALDAGGAPVDDGPVGAGSAAAIDAKLLADFGMVSATFYEEGVMVTLLDPKIVPPTITVATVDDAGVKRDYAFKASMAAEGGRYWYAALGKGSAMIEDLPSKSGLSFTKDLVLGSIVGLPGMMGTTSTKRTSYAVWINVGCVTRKPPNPRLCG